MIRLRAAAMLIGLTGCVASITPYGTYIEPLADVNLIGPPVVVQPPSPVVVQPLQPVVVVPDRSVYFYGGSYYYSWGDSWYWSREKRGPLHPLRRDYWPARVEHHDHGRHGGDAGGPEQVAQVFAGKLHFPTGLLRRGGFLRTL